MVCVNFTIITPIRVTGVLRPVLAQKNQLAAEPPSVWRPIPHTPLPQLCISPQMPDWFFSQKNWQMIGIWLIVEQHWALSLAAKMLAHLAPFSKGQMGNLSPHGAVLKNWEISRQAFYSNLFASRCGWSHPGHWLFKKIQSHCFYRNQPNTVACSAAASPAPHLPSAALSAHPLFIYSWLIQLASFI